MRIIDQYKPNNVLSTNVEARSLVRWFVRSNSTHRNKFREDFLDVSREQEITKVHLLVISPKQNLAINCINISGLNEDTGRQFLIASLLALKFFQGYAYLLRTLLVIQIKIMGKDWMSYPKNSRRNQNDLKY